MLFVRRGIVSETFVSYSPSTPADPWRPLKKRTDSKKGPLLGCFGGKTGRWREKKRHFILHFFTF